MEDPSVRLPAESRVEVVDFGPERMVIYVPPGGKQAQGWGCFAILWNGILLVVTGGFLAAAPKEIVPFVFLSFFWLVGLVMMYAWLRMRFTRLHILLERGRLFIQRTLFGRKWMTETVLTDSSRAQLVESYQQNDVPVYRVEVTGAGGAAKFGTSLSDDEKHWFIETINRFLKVEGAVSPVSDEPRECVNCGEELAATAISPSGRWKCTSCGAEGVFADVGGPAMTATKGEVVPALDPEAMPVDVDVVVDYAGHDRLMFHLPLFPAGKARRITALVALVASVFWIGLPCFFLVQKFLDIKDWFDWLPVIFLGMVGMTGGIALIIAAAAVRGRISVTVDENELSCRWHWGALGFRKRVATAMIARVSLDPAFTHRSGSGPEVPSELKACFVHFRGGSVPLTTFHGAETARTAAGLVRHQLERFGIELNDE